MVQALLATSFTWAVTALGAATVFMARDVSRRVLDTMLGFAGGVMIAASYWSLLAPAIEMSEGKEIPAWFPAVVGFLFGGIFLWGIDKVLPHLHLGFSTEEAEGVKTSWQRTILLILAITLHNIPEGLAVGVAFGALAAGLPSATFGAATVIIAQPILPYALSFTAGAMIFVVIEEVIPEAQRGGNTDLATMGGMVGFAVMMLLDVAFG